MEKIFLKNSDLEVSRLCFGGCPMGQYGWGKVSRDDMLSAIDKAVDAGVNFFDNADIYGLGVSETNLGCALKDKRDKVVIATKFGVRIENGKTFYDNSPEWIEKALEKSLKRLGTDYIDIYQMHYRDTKTPIEDIVDTLDRLKQKGYIRYYGLSNVGKADLDELMPYKDKFISLQDEYSLACRKNEQDILLLSDKLDLTPMTWGSLGQGILTGKYDRDSVFGNDDRRSRKEYVNFHGDKLEKNLKIVDEMKKISERIKKPLSAIAIRFILDYIPGSIAITGIKKLSQLDSNLAGLDWSLSKEDIDILDKISG